MLSQPASCRNCSRLTRGGIPDEGTHQLRQSTDVRSGHTRPACLWKGGSSSPARVASIPRSGQIVSDDLAEQTEQTFRNIESLLAAAGASLDDVVSCLVHLTDLAQFEAFNAIYEQKFPGVKPVRTTVRADLVGGMLVEVTVIANAG